MNITPENALNTIEESSNEIAWHLLVCEENGTPPDQGIIKIENKRIKQAHDLLDNFAVIKISNQTK